MKSNKELWDRGVVSPGPTRRTRSELTLSAHVELWEIVTITNREDAPSGAEPGRRGFDRASDFG